MARSYRIDRSRSPRFRDDAVRAAPAFEPPSRSLCPRGRAAQPIDLSRPGRWREAGIGRDEVVISFQDKIQ